MKRIPVPASISGNSGGNITVYAYGNCVDGTGGTSGDAAAGDSYTLTLNPVVSNVKETELAASVELNLFPNPVVNNLNVRLDSKETAQYNLSVYNNSGQTLRQQSLQANAGDNQLSIEVSEPYVFNKNALETINKNQWVNNQWPLVYFIQNDSKRVAYVGESTNFSNRSLVLEYL